MNLLDQTEATEAIRAGKTGEKNSAVPIIVLTADMMDSTRERVFELGVNDYMNKPVDQKILYQKITTLLYLKNNIQVAQYILTIFNTCTF